MEANDVPDQPGESLIIIKLELETEDNLNSDEESQAPLYLLNAEEEPFQTENENIGEIRPDCDQLKKTLNHEHSQKEAVRVKRKNELRNCEKGFMLKLDGSEQSLVTDANVLVKRSARVVYVDENNCKMCGKSFQLKARLATHVRYRHELPIIPDGQDEMGKEGDTEKCVKDASSLGLEEKYDIQSSQRRDTPENVTTDYLKTEQNVCNVCPQRFPQADNLKTHCTQNISLVKDERANQGRHRREGWIITNKLVQNKNVQQSSSNTCDQKIPRISLGKLETIKEDNSNHICDHIDCNKSFKSAKRLKYHLKKYHQAQLFVCNYEGCSDKFEKYANLRIHFKTHIGEPPYVCDYEDCKRSFKSYQALKVHTKCHTGDDLYSCCHADCGKSFTTKGKLKVHAKTHTGDDLYTCCQAGCGKSFTTKWKLKIHTKNHTGDDLYTCFHAGCGKSFTTNSKLKIHLRKHTGEKPHVCDECNKGFSRSDHLKRHLRTHTGEKPHACTVCQKQFATFTLCKRHGMSHTGEKPYSCKVCQKKFSREDTLKKHVIICQG